MNTAWYLEIVAWRDDGIGDRPCGHRHRSASEALSCYMEMVATGFGPEQPWEHVYARGTVTDAIPVPWRSNYVDDVENVQCFEAAELVGLVVKERRGASPSPLPADHPLASVADHLLWLAADGAWIPEDDELTEGGHDPSETGWPILAAGTGDGGEGDRLIVTARDRETAEAVAEAINFAAETVRRGRE